VSIMQLILLSHYFLHFIRIIFFFGLKLFTLRIRKSTWLQLLLYSGGALSETLRKLTKNDILYPLLMDEHYKAIERRLMIIYTAVELCKERYGNDIFK
jgi:hypothetical protein